MDEFKGDFAGSFKNAYSKTETLKRFKISPDRGLTAEVLLM
jgi:hypothetical protein